VAEVRVMDLDATVEEEERRLEDHNEAQDARYFLGFGDTHGDPIEVDTVVGSQIGIGTGSTSPLAAIPNPDQATDPDASGSNMKKRYKCWNDFDELTKIVNGKKVRYAACCKHLNSFVLISINNMLLYMINFVKCMYLYIALLLVRASGRPGTFRPTANGPARHDLSVCVPGLGMFLGMWASTTRPEASTGCA
jgi:hypothetical protein